MIEPAVIRQFVQRVQGWSQISVVEQDEIISDVLEAFRKKQLSGQQFITPLNWLMKAAKMQKQVAFRSRREMKRKRELYQSIYLPDRHHGTSQLARTQDKLNAQSSRHLDLESSDEWRRLAPEHKALFRLVFVEELQVTEAAKVIGVCRSTAKSWIDRGRRKLARDPQLRLMAKIDIQQGKEGVQCK